jgi:malate dehydrogenase (oxaloacetate-decarboxylating)(NADP+)
MLIGVSATPGVFDEPGIRAMARVNARPIVLPLSNPTSKSECTAEEAYTWSGGRAIFACGSPFPAFTLNGKTFVPRQGNNSYIFPGVGLGAVSVKTRRVTNEMFLAAAETLAGMVSEADLAQGSIYPPLSDMRAVSAAIGTAVAKVAFDRGLATVPKPADIGAYVRSQMYEPNYPTYA